MNEINASIITIGDELLIGQTIDTNSVFIAQQLNKIGIWVKRRIAVGDVYDDIWQALDEEKKYAELIIITGGLGPTADDITKPLLCDYFKTKLVRNEAVLKRLEVLSEKVYKRTIPLSESNIKQSDLPENCVVLPNNYGSASGMWFEQKNQQGKNVIFISLPGVPYEMQKILTEEASSRLRETFGGYAVLHKTLSTFGVGESIIAEKISSFESRLPDHIKLAYLPSYGMVKLRLTGKGKDALKLEKEMNTMFHTMSDLLKGITISENDDPLEKILGDMLLEKHKTVATAESCTGGNIAHLLTSIPGSSAYYLGSVVAYSNEVKTDLIQVSQEILESVGAVSEQIVKEMVVGTIKNLKSDYAIATSGIMGPDGGTPDKPIGTVWIAAGSASKIITKKLSLGFDRMRNIQTASLHALNLLRQFIVSENN